MLVSQRASTARPGLNQARAAAPEPPKSQRRHDLRQRAGDQPLDMEEPSSDRNEVTSIFGPRRGRRSLSASTNPSTSPGCNPTRSSSPSRPTRETTNGRTRSDSSARSPRRALARRSGTRDSGPAAARRSSAPALARDDIQLAKVTRHRHQPLRDTQAPHRARSSRRNRSSCGPQSSRRIDFFLLQRPTQMRKQPQRNRRRARPSTAASTSSPTNSRRIPLEAARSPGSRRIDHQATSSR